MRLPGLAGRDIEVGSGRTRLMGVVNVTPDSFSDGGQFLDPRQAIAHGLRLVAEGADLLDIGGESTRPGYQRVTAEQQLERILPVIEGLRSRVQVPISVDTTLRTVAEAALSAGADWVNDTTAFGEDPGLAELCADQNVTVVLMHRFEPSRKGTQGPPEGAKMVAQLADTLGQLLSRAAAAGIESHRIVLDPGLGFGTRPEDNQAILAHIATLRQLGQPLLVGPSRKSFLGELTGKPADQRLMGTAAAATSLALAGVEIIRVHDVAEMVDVVRVADAIRSCGNAAGSEA